MSAAYAKALQGLWPVQSVKLLERSIRSDGTVVDYRCRLGTHPFRFALSITPGGRGTSPRTTELAAIGRSRVSAPGRDYQFKVDADSGLSNCRRLNDRSSIR